MTNDRELQQQIMLMSVSDSRVLHLNKGRRRSGESEHSVTFKGGGVWQRQNFLMILENIFKFVRI
jgi:hypothetical protein